MSLSPPLRNNNPTRPDHPPNENERLATALLLLLSHTQTPPDSAQAIITNLKAGEEGYSLFCEAACDILSAYIQDGLPSRLAGLRSGREQIEEIRQTIDTYVSGGTITNDLHNPQLVGRRVVYDGLLRRWRQEAVGWIRRADGLLTRYQGAGSGADP